MNFLDTASIIHINYEGFLTSSPIQLRNVNFSFKQHSLSLHSPVATITTLIYSRERHHSPEAQAFLQLLQHH